MCLTHRSSIYCLCQSESRAAISAESLKVARVKPARIILATHPAVTAWDQTNNSQGTGCRFYLVSNAPYQSSFTSTLIYLSPLDCNYGKSSFSAEGYMNKIHWSRWFCSGIYIYFMVSLPHPDIPAHFMLPVTGAAALTKWHVAVKRRQDHGEL